MRRLWLTVLLATGAMLSLGHGQTNPVQVPTIPLPTPLQKFDGIGTQTTASFQVPGSWKLYYHSHLSLRLTVYSSDGKIITGVADQGNGTLYFSTGGTYYLKIEGYDPSQYVEPPAPTENKPSGLMGTITDGLNPKPTDNSTGNQNQPPQPSVDPMMPHHTVGWSVSVYDGATEIPEYHYILQYNAPSGASSLASATPPSPTSSPAPTNASTPVATKLTEDQTRAIVLIRGDKAEGTGFLVKTADGPAVVTNLHVIGNNPNIKITTSNGNVVTMLSAKGASDRDLALLQIKDQGYSYLDLSTDMANTVQTGDDVITPGNSQGGGVVLSTGGKVLGVGPDRIEFDNPIYHGNSGGPVFHPKTGKVLGVVTMAIKVEQNNDLDKASFASRNSAITKGMRYFGLRLDTVPSWIPLDWQRFQTETIFLDQFHQQSLSLDSFLNPPAKSTAADGSATSSDDDSQLYLNDKKIMDARDTFIRQSAGTDGAQRVQALRELLFDLTSVADNGLEASQDMSNFYSFDQEQAKNEGAYRKALKDEIDTIGNDISRLNGLASRSSN